MSKDFCLKRPEKKIRKNIPVIELIFEGLGNIPAIELIFEGLGNIPGIELIFEGLGHFVNQLYFLIPV